MAGKAHLVLAIILILVFLAILTIIFPQFAPQEELKEIKVTSPAFQDGERIPEKYSKKGGDVSPPISWEKVEGAACYALVMYDPDAPGRTFYHWIIINIPPGVISLPENVPKVPEIKGLGVQCINDYEYVGYGGPMPPKGKTHRYVFTVYALDSYIEVEQPCGREIIDTIKKHAIAYGKITGLYGG